MSARWIQYPPHTFKLARFEMAQGRPIAHRGADIATHRRTNPAAGTPKGLLRQLGNGGAQGVAPVLGYAGGMAEEPDNSEQFDLVTVFRSDEHNAEMEALAIQGLLEAAGIPAVLVGTAVLPVLPFEVRVPRARQQEAERLIAESQVSGPQAAEEAAGEIPGAGPENEDGSELRE
jgi:hypothetical protein